MTIMTPVGRVVRDFELKTSPKGREYVQFSLAVNEGFGDNKTTEFYDCVAFDNVARRLVKAMVKQGSLIHVCGRFSTSVYDRNDGSGKGVALKLIILDWDFIPGSSTKKDDNGDNGDGPAAAAHTTTVDQAADGPTPGFVRVAPENFDGDDLPF